ncbi:MAG: NHLP bacteriocin export ABC transporter permease/ATPase subunit [Clostridiaceae bacterium]|nr:NHLP bacteriocin export ABC transporter permease/ATPase subunit [Clostridiaceae bacterium]
MAGWFDEQIKNRIQYDEEGFQSAFAQLSSVVMGKSAISDALSTDRLKTKNAIEEILKYYHVKLIPLPEDIEGMNDQLEYLLRPTGIMRRVVKLERKWWRNAVGPMLGQTKDGDVVALIPAGLNGYKFFDYESGKDIKLSRKTCKLLRDEAFCFYRPLPLKKLGLKDLVRYIITTLSCADIFLIIMASLGVSLLGLFSPYATRLLFDQVIPSGELGLLLPMTVLLLGVSVSSIMIGIVKSLLMTRVQTKMNIPVQAAAMSRLFSLPAAFFKEYNSGELSARLSAVSQLCQMLSSALLSTGLTTLFSFIYIFQMMGFAPALVGPAMLVILIQLAVTTATGLLQIKLNRRRMKLGAKLNGLTFSSFSGVQKIKLAGAERRIFAKWAETYKQGAEISYNPPAFIKLQSIIAGLISLAGTIAIYYSAASSAVSMADYMAFNASYGMVSGSIMALAGITTTFANIKPLMEMVEPILKQVPETGEAKRTVSRLSGNIEINNVSFRYNEEMPLVLNDISLKIRSGQYIALVGKTGCGKSTLMRLLLGFETPQRGAIYFDGQDIARLDLRSLRQNIGSVMQNGQLFSGDIFANIVVTAPWLSLDDAWQAAELAGIADDIRAMPMGMHTMISEGSGGISGGQRQRILIARAIVAKPRILIFDEATSALDNISQKHVSEALDSLHCTRIVIAHRLSTIRHCDRIIVLEDGSIMEDGSYDELIAKGGYFSELVKRQRLDDEAFAGKTTVF